MAESRDDARDDFAVTMLADQHMRTRSAIPDRDHQLLGMPKSQNNVAAFTIQPIDRFMPARLAPHRPRDRSNQPGRDRRQQRALGPPLDPLLYADLTRITLHSSTHHPLLITCSHPCHILKLQRVQPVVGPSALQQFFVRPRFDDGAPIQHNDTIRVLNRREAMRDHQRRPILH